MATAYADIFTALALPFEAWQVKTKEITYKNGARSLIYVSARTIANRFDEVLGPENWWDVYQARDHDYTTVVCSLSIRLPDGQVVTKQDAGGAAGMDDAGDDGKSAYTDALKRVAAKFGCGRYLWDDGVPAFARDAFKAAERAIATGRPVAELPPPPREVMPPRQPVRETPQPQVLPGPASDVHPALKSARDCYNYLKDAGLLSQMDKWAKSQGYPSRILSWTLGQCAAGLEEAERIMAGTQRRVS